jgi:hypothetical protein
VFHIPSWSYTPGVPEDSEKSSLVSVLEIPIIGEFIGLLIVVFPALVAGWLGIGHAIPDGSIGDIVIALGLIIWCAALEKMIGIRFVLPLIRLPITWLATGYLLVALWKLAFHKG